MEIPKQLYRLRSDGKIKRFTDFYIDEMPHGSRGEFLRATDGPIIPTLKYVEEEERAFDTLYEIWFEHESELAECVAKINQAAKKAVDKANEEADRIAKALESVKIP